MRTPDPRWPGQSIQRSHLAPRAQALLDAILAISSHLDLDSVLTRIVEAAADLTGAGYGALGVIGADGRLAQFHSTGFDSTLRALDDNPPSGLGIFSQLIAEPRAARLEELGSHASTVAMPAHRPPRTTFLGVPIRIRGTVFGNLYLAEKVSGEEFSEYDEVLVRALADAAGLVIESARAYDVSEQRRRWLEVTAALSASLSELRTMDEALAQIAWHARRATDADLVAVLQATPTRPVVTATAGAGPTTRISVFDEVFEAFGTAQDGEPPEGEVVIGPTKALVQPLRAHLSDPYVLVVIRERPVKDVDAEERELLASFAEQAGLALDRIQAERDREALAVVSDRHRIARELHDSVIQRLFALGMKLEGVRIRPDQVDERVEDVVEDLDVVIREIRSTIFGLNTREPDSPDAPDNLT